MPNLNKTLLSTCFLLVGCSRLASSFSPKPFHRTRSVEKGKVPFEFPPPFKTRNEKFVKTTTTLWGEHSEDNPIVVRPFPASNLVCLAGTLVSWSVISWKGLMYHPVATVAKDLCLRHNILTVAHALAFPLPVAAAAFIAVHQTKSNHGKYNQELEHRINRRLCLGIAATSIWTAAAVFWGPIFSVGYDLFSDSIRYGCAAVHVTTAALFISLWRQHSGVSLSGMIRGCVGSMFSILTPKMAEGTGRLDNSKSNDPALFSASSLGLLLLAIIPQLVNFPHATIPTLLGKRLSRTASGFTFLGAVSAYCLQDAAECNSGHNNNAAIKTLRRGLAVGSIAHLGLVIAKIIGVDGGGLIIPGRGLWELYPSLVNASGAATFLMFATFFILGLACTQ